MFTVPTNPFSPRPTARITGVIYLITIATGLVAQGYISATLIKHGNAAATAANIIAHKDLLQLAYGLFLVEMACNIAVVALFYVLLRPVHRTLSLVAAFIGLAACTIKATSRIFFIAPLVVLGGAQYLAAFTAEQLRAIALLILSVNDAGAAMALVFFGFYTLLTGYLIVRSTFLPRAFGVLGMLAGVGWLCFLYPPLGHNLFVYIALLALAGVLSLSAWLIVRGVDEQRWNEQEATRT